VVENGVHFVVLSVEGCIHLVVYFDIKLNGLYEDEDAPVM
jgi:hypothetical protein